MRRRTIRRIAAVMKPGATLYASTGNIAYVLLRLSLLAGQFNYGKRGILDLTHRRLFTIYSFTKLLRNRGFTIRTVRGFGPPIRDMIGESSSLRLADSLSGLLARRWPRLFAFNFLVVAEKGRTAELDRIAVEFERLVAADERRLEVELTTAYELSDEDERRILEQIEQASGRKVEATRKVDPDLIGGVVLQAGSLRVDASVRGRLERLRHELVTRS